MVKQLLAYNPIAQNVLAIECSQNLGNPAYMVAELKLKKGEIDVNITKSVSEISELQKEYNTKKATLLLTDEFVLSKQVAHTGTDAEILGEAFPNLNSADFYYQILRSGGTAFIAVCRKDHVDGYIQRFKDAGIWVTEIALGSLKMISFASYIQNVGVLNHTSLIEYGDDQIKAITTKAEEAEEEQYLSLIHI